MRAIRYEAADFGAPILPVARECAAPAGREVVVEVSHCGVCHTDLHVHEGHYDLGGGRTLNFAERGIRPPLVLGHEIVGRPVANGTDANAALGVPVLVYPWIGCEKCARCAAGEGHLCTQAAFLGIYRPGGYASHVIVPDEKFLVPLDGLEPTSAAPLACSGLTVWGAIKRITAPRETSAVAVIGCGGLGLTAVALLKTLGWSHIVALDPAAAKRKAAEALGAQVTLDPTEFSPQSLDGIFEAPLLGVLDFVGNEATSSLGLGALAKGGAYVIVGLFGGELRTPLPLLPVRAISIIGSYVGSLGDLHEYVAHVRAHGAPEIPLHHRPMADAQETLMALSRGEISGRAILCGDGAER